MKKLGVFVIFLLFISLLSFAVRAEETPGLSDVPGAEQVQAGQEKYEQYTTAENKSDFLKKEWGALLSKQKYIGPVLIAVNKVSPVADPVFKYTTGMKPSLTWLFILNLLLWITIIVFCYRALRFTATFSTWVQYAVSIIVAVIISVLGVTKTLATFVVNSISLLATWWMQLIVVIIVIAGIIIANLLSKNLEKAEKQEMKRQEERREKAKLKELEIRIKTQEDVTKSIGDSFNDGAGI